MMQAVRIVNAVYTLGKLLPARTCVHIGVGGKVDLGIADPDLTGARDTVLIEADDRRFKRLASARNRLRGIHVLNAIIGTNADKVPFYTLSLEGESGLLDAGALKGIWPNIEVTGSQPRVLRSLEALFFDKLAGSLSISTCNWLILGCLPSVTLLEGVSSLFDQIDVCVVRCLSGGGQAGQSSVEGLSYDYVTGLLGRHGLVCVSEEVERNNCVSLCVFARNWKSRSASLSERLAVADKSLLDLEVTHAETAEQLLRREAELIGQKADGEAALSELQSRCAGLEQQLEQALRAEEDARNVGQIAQNNLETLRQSHAETAERLLRREAELVAIGVEIKRIISMPIPVLLPAHPTGLPRSSPTSRAKAKASAPKAKLGKP